MGRRFADAGHGVRISLARVENRNVGCTVARTLERHTRWTKMRRALAPSGFAFEPILTPFVIALFAFALSPSRETVAAVAFTAVLQMLGAQLALRACRGHALAWTWAPLELVRSLLVLVCWLRACLSRRVQWRGHPFRLGVDSTITPIAPRRLPASSTASV
jgi:ceramide glucosyltransferase